MDPAVSYCHPELSLSRRTHVRRGIFYSNNNNNNVRWKNRRSTSLIPSPPHHRRITRSVYLFVPFTFVRSRDVTLEHASTPSRHTGRNYFGKKRTLFFVRRMRLIWKTIGQRHARRSRVTTEKQNVSDGQTTQDLKNLKYS